MNKMDAQEESPLIQNEMGEAAASFSKDPSRVSPWTKRIVGILLASSGAAALIMASASSTSMPDPSEATSLVRDLLSNVF